MKYEKEYQEFVKGITDKFISIDKEDFLRVTHLHCA